MISPYELRGLEKGRQEGRQEGREEGRLEERREAIRTNARMLLGSVPESLEASLLKTNSLEELEHVQQEMLRSYLSARGEKDLHG